MAITEEAMRSCVDSDARLSRPERFAACESETDVLVRMLAAERDQAQQELLAALRERDRARAQLSDAERRHESFLATLAHELRNPLAPIRSALQLMRMAAGDEATALAARTIIERQLKQLVRFIDDLMDVSRITHGQLELRKERVDLGTVIRLAVDSNHALLESRQQHLRINVPAEPLYVEADTTRLAQVFSNLLNNSAKFSDTHAEITVRAYREGGQAVVTVSDNGIGIERDMLVRVFDLFAPAQGARTVSSHTGLGVGLTLVKRLIELHGGTVHAHSDGPGQGSVFTVRLDLLLASECDAMLTASPARTHTTHPRIRILIADDNYDAAQSLALVLSMDGHEVCTANDGAEALELAEQFRPQVVLLDLGMPKLDGYETARRLRQRPWARSTRLFAVTGWGQEDDRQRTKQAGFHRHLVKPLDPEMLSELLTQVLEDHEIVEK